MHNFHKYSKELRYITFRAMRLSVEVTSLVGKFQQLARLRLRVWVPPAELFYIFLRACYSIAPNGPVFIYFKIIWAFKKIVHNLRKMIILQFIFIFKSLCFIVFHFGGVEKNRNFLKNVHVFNFSYCFSKIVQKCSCFK